MLETNRSVSDTEMTIASLSSCTRVSTAFSPSGECTLQQVRPEDIPWRSLTTLLHLLPTSSVQHYFIFLSNAIHTFFFQKLVLKIYSPKSSQSESHDESLFPTLRSELPV